MGDSEKSHFRMREFLFFLIFNFSSGLIPTLENLNDRLKKLQDKNDEFEPKIKNLEETNHDLKLKVKHLEAKNHGLEEKVKSLEKINREFVLVEQKKLSEAVHQVQTKTQSSTAQIKQLESSTKSDIGKLTSDIRTCSSRVSTNSAAITSINSNLARNDPKSFPRFWVYHYASIQSNEVYKPLKFDSW